MKSARLFLAGMYLHPILCAILCVWIPYLIWIYVLVPAANDDQVGMLVGAMIGIIFFPFVYIVMIGVIITLGVIGMDMANKAYGQGEYEKIKRGWLLLKYAAIPFYVINLIYIRFLWIEIIGIRSNIHIFEIFFVLIPVIISCMMVFQSGYVGWCYIKYLKKQPEIADTTAPFLYFMQLIMGLDVISTILLCRKEKKLIRSE